MTDASTLPLACVILAAGKGSRLKSDLPKVLHPVAGEAVLAHILRACGAMNPQRLVLVVGPDMEDVEQAAAPHECVVQTKQLGTGHAVMAARAALQGFVGDVLVVYGDHPLLTPHTLQALVDARRQSGAQASVMGFCPPDPASYGRFITDESGALKEIVEFSDASPEQKAITLVNCGLMTLVAPQCWDQLARIDNKNAKEEYYLTDLVSLINREGGLCAYSVAPLDETPGFNDRAQLAEVERAMQERLRRQAMEQGVTLVAPETVFLCADTKLGRDVIIHPHVVFGPGVVVEDRAEIGPFCHVQQLRVRKGTKLTVTPDSGPLVHGDSVTPFSGPHPRSRYGT